MKKLIFALTLFLFAIGTTDAQQYGTIDTERIVAVGDSGTMTVQNDTSFYKFLRGTVNDSTLYQWQRWDYINGSKQVTRGSVPLADPVSYINSLTAEGQKIVALRAELKARWDYLGVHLNTLITERDAVQAAQ